MRSGLRRAGAAGQSRRVPARPRRLLRRLRAPLIGLGALVLLAALGVAGALWATLPPRHARVAIAGLAAPVAITFDQYGIPRIRAGSLADAMTALGYVHARDRLFQMELMRRVAAGRLAAIAGPAALPLDREMRTLGLARAARADEAALPADTRALLAAYARGVNAFIAAHGRFAAPEFLWLGAPKPWRPVDSLLWAKTMGLWLSLNWRQELARWQLARHGHLSRAAILALWPPQHEAGSPDAALTPGPDGGRERGPKGRPVGARRFAALTARALAAALPSFPAPFTQPDTASNAWAVDGRHSATGKPLLAGDPHLGFGFPSLWYLARIDTPHTTLVGATAPGVPGVVLGRNRHIAWSFTSTGADVQDIFVETPVGQGEYATPDGPRPFHVRLERIRVRGGKDVLLRVRSTRHGPVISDLFDASGSDPSGSAPSGPVLAVAMENLRTPDTAAEGLLALGQAGSVAQAGQAAALISAPVQNLIVADDKNIGLFVTGRVPIRRSGDGAMPVDGASGACDWIGTAAGAALPRIVDPPSGRLVNANNRVAPADFPVFLGRDWFADWRARRIRDLLRRGMDHGGRLTVDAFVRMQRDVTSLFARAVLPALLAVPPPPGRAGVAERLLVGWHGAMRRDLPQPLIFQAWTRRFYQLVMRRAHIPPQDAGFVAPLTEFLPAALAPGGFHGGGRWCGGDCLPLLRTALTQAVAGLAARFGPDPADWRWGTAHRAVFADPMLRRIPLLGRLATFAIAVPGSATTIDAAATEVGHFTAVHGPEFRAVYDLADLDASRFIMAPGQSGNPLSRHADDLLRRWRDGRSLTIGPKPGRVTATLLLVPAAGSVLR